MNPSDDEDTAELSQGLSLIDELQNGMAALWRRLKTIKATLPDEDRAGNTGKGEHRS